MDDFDRPILSVNHLSKQFGPGCIHCSSGQSDSLIKNYCPTCGTVYACRDISFDLYPGSIRYRRGKREREIYSDAMLVFRSGGYRR